MLQTIDSQDTNIDRLFHDFYVVPDYQREYVWETRHVEQFLNDIHGEFTGANGREESEYFIGSIVVCSRPDRLFEVIDGQQRVTTAYVFLCALRDYLTVSKMEPVAALAGRIRDATTDRDGNDVFRYRVELQYEDSGDILKRIADGTPLTGGLPRTKSVENIREAYRAASTFLQSQFGVDTKALRQFYSFFVNNVKLVRIRTESIAHALRVFETINDRGKGLDAMDLLKNLMFMEASRSDFAKLKRKWKQLVDTLYHAGEKPLRFLRYFAFAQYDVLQQERLREDQVYRWFVDNREACGYGEHPLEFVDVLLEAASAYRDFLEGKDVTGEPNRYLANIRYLSGSVKQHLILLLASRTMDPACFTALCQHVENLFFVYLIARENTREFERRFVQWAKELRGIRDLDALRGFIAEKFEPAKRELSGRFDLALGSLDESSIQQYRLRYLLAKLTQHVNEAAYGSHGAEVSLATYINRKVHIEHILPQHPSAAALAEFDKADEVAAYVGRLGNLALAEEPINISLGNRPFSQKREIYGKSKFLLTHLISKRVAVGANTAVDRAVKGFEPFDAWSTENIEKRQEMLRLLARRVWQLPKSEEAR